MEDPGKSKAQGNAKDVGGTWKHAIKVAYEVTKSSFPGGEVLAHLDQKLVISVKESLLNLNIAYIDNQVYLNAWFHCWDFLRKEHWGCYKTQFNLYP